VQVRIKIQGILLLQFKFLQYETDNNGWLKKILGTKREDII
jgi:hypothetical protein